MTSTACLSPITAAGAVLEEHPGLRLLHDPPAEGPTEGTCVPWDERSLHRSVSQGVAGSLHDGLFTHQHEAIEHALAGRHCVVATRTSSGCVCD